MNMGQLNMVVCVESGILEAQALLFLRALEWSGNQDVRVHCYSPRPDSLPTDETLLLLEQMGAIINCQPLNQDFKQYPIANKLLACQNLEARLEPNSNVMFSDTDTVFLNTFNHDVKGLFLRPVDNKGPGSEGHHDPNDDFWQQVFSLCEVTLPAPQVKTTVRPHVIRNYFNAGLIWVSGLKDFYQAWYDDFIKIVESGLRPFGWQSRDGDDFRCLDQVALAVTATRFADDLVLLPETFNYPIPFRPIMQSRDRHPRFEELVHVHYHKWFQHREFLNHVGSESDKKSGAFNWLIEQLPLKPEVFDQFKC